MNLYEVMFLISFFGCLGVLAWKIINIFNLGKVYGGKGMWLTFMAYPIFWVVAFIVLASNPTDVLYIMLFKLLSWAFVLNVLFLIIEIFLTIKDEAVKPVEAYNAFESRAEGSKSR